MDKQYVSELTVSEIREMIVQSVFGVSYDDLSALLATHQITINPIAGLQYGLTPLAQNRFQRANLEAVSAIMCGSDVLIDDLATMLGTYQIPDDIKIWSWDTTDNQ